MYLYVYVCFKLLFNILYKYKLHKKYCKCFIRGEGQLEHFPKKLRGLNKWVQISKSGRRTCPSYWLHPSEIVVLEENKQQLTLDVSMGQFLPLFRQDEKTRFLLFVLTVSHTVSCCRHKESARKRPAAASAEQGCDRGEQFWLGVDREHWQECSL